MIRRTCLVCKKAHWAKADNVRPKTEAPYYKARTTACKPCRRKKGIAPLEQKPGYRAKRSKRKHLKKPTKPVRKKER